MDLGEKLNHDDLEKINVFIGKLLIAGIIFRAAIFLIPDTYILESSIAFVSGTFLQFIGSSVEIFGNRLVTHDTIFVVTQDCTGWKSIAALTGLSWASDIDDKKNLILKGSIALILLNLVRIVTTIHLSTIGVIDFAILHQFLWRWGLTAAVFVIWIYWMSEQKSTR